MRPDAPNDHEAEKSLIGCILLRPESAAGLVAKLRQEDFYAPPLGHLFAACCDLAALNKPVSAATVARQVPADVLADFGGQQQVVACMEGVLPGEADYWVERILVMAKARRLLKAGDLARQYALGDPAEVDGGFAKAEAALYAARGPGESIAIDMASGVALFKERFSRYLNNPDGLTGMATGWVPLDRTLDGLRPGAVVTIFAKTGHWKSWLAANIGWRLARAGIPGTWVVTESQAVDVLERLHCLEAGVNIQDIRFRHELYAYQSAIEEASGAMLALPITINPNTEIDVEGLKGYVAHQVRAKGIQYMIVDLLDHVHSSKHKELAEEEYVMYQMKDIAKRFNILVLLTTHIRKADKFMTPGITIDPSEMKGAASKSQDSDALISVVPVKFEEPSGSEFHAFPPKPMTRDDIMAAQAAGGHIPLLLGVVKNRHGPERNHLFEIDMSQGGRMEPYFQK